MDTRKQKTKNLRDMRKGQRGRIVQLFQQNADHVHKLMSLGVLPGERVEVLQVFPAYVIKLGYTQIALDKFLAQAVEVDLDDTGD